MYLNKEYMNGKSCIPAEELPGYLSSIQKEWDKKPTCGPKTNVERFLANGVEFFPDRLIIPRVITEADDTEAIQTALMVGIETNHSMGIRTIADRPIFSGAKLPWDLGIDTADKAQTFLQTTLPTWRTDAALNNYHIGQLILMSNPPEIGTKEERPNQFVFRLSWDVFSSLNCLESNSLLEMTIGTNRLRALDRRMEQGDDQVVRFQSFYRQTGFLGSTDLAIGSAYQGNPKYIDTIMSVLNTLENQIEDPIVQLLRRLDFFADLGLNIVEFQGYVDEKTNRRNMYIYGLRGTNDDTQTGLRPCK